MHNYEGPSQLSPSDVAAMEKFAADLRAKPRTPAERLMKVIIDTHFNRYCFLEQVALHNRVADFYSSKLNLAVEVDGSYHNSQHWWVAPDGYKERALRKRGFNMIRFANGDVVSEPEWVIEQLTSILPAFEIPIAQDGPCCPLGIIHRLNRKPPFDPAEFRLESVEATPAFEKLVARIKAHSSTALRERRVTS